MGRHNIILPNKISNLSKKPTAYISSEMIEARLTQIIAQPTYGKGGDSFNNFLFLAKAGRYCSKPPEPKTVNKTNILMKKLILPIASTDKYLAIIMNNRNAAPLLTIEVPIKIMESLFKSIFNFIA